MPAYSRGNLLGTAGQPEDKVSRPRKLWLRCERYFVTESGGMHTFKTVDLFNNQQIMKTSMQRLKTLPVTVVAADTSDVHADAVTKRSQYQKQLQMTTHRLKCLQQEMLNSGQQCCRASD